MKRSSTVLRHKAYYGTYALAVAFMTRLKILGISINKRKRKSYCAMQTTCKIFSSAS
jgi:hypothetical protein